jgi:WD40 repeat protein
VWDVERKKALAVLKGHEDIVNYVAFKPRTHLLASASHDTTVRIWDADAARELAVLRGHEKAVECVGFNHNGERLASSSMDQTIRLWDTAKLQTVTTLRGHQSRVWSIQFHPNGNRLVSVSLDGTGRIWDLGRAQELAVLRGFVGRAIATAFSPNGQVLITATNQQESTPQIWDTVSYQERYPAIARYRAAKATMQNRLQSRLSNGEDIDQITQSFRDDKSIDDLHRRAAQALVCEERYRRQKKAEAEQRSKEKPAKPKTEKRIDRAMMT